MKKTFTRITFVLLSFTFTTSCSTKFGDWLDGWHADWINSCTGKKDCDECKTWFTKYPKEYQHYQKRMKRRNFDDYCRFDSISK